MESNNLIWQGNLSNINDKGFYTVRIESEDTKISGVVEDFKDVIETILYRLNNMKNVKVLISINKILDKWEEEEYLYIEGLVNEVKNTIKDEFDINGETGDKYE
ncbi:MAG: hypothetical protein QXZ12_06905 [Thermoplasmata archaeon]